MRAVDRAPATWWSELLCQRRYRSVRASGAAYLLAALAILVLFGLRRFASRACRSIWRVTARLSFAERLTVGSVRSGRTSPGWGM